MHAGTELPQPAEKPPLELQRRLLPTLRDALRLRRYSLKTEKAYLHWVRRYIRFHRMRHPKDMGAKEVTAFLNHLASERQVAAATQNQALAALLFLYRQVLETELPWMDDLVRAKTSKRLPTVLTRDEVSEILAQLSGTRWLLVSLLYGAGLRLNECLSLRVKDVDFAGGQLIVRQGKGNKDRVTLMPQRLKPLLLEHLDKVKVLHAEDLAHGTGRSAYAAGVGGKVPQGGLLMGLAIHISFHPVLPRPIYGENGAISIHEKTLQRAVKEAGRRACIAKPVGCHTFRHAFATHLLESGHNLRVVQELMGHKHVETTMIYTHVMNNSLAAVRSPADVLHG